jgi:hypothetical protein
VGNVEKKHAVPSVQDDKEFCFSLIGLNSTFLVVPQSEFTSREPQGFYSEFQRFPTRDEISFPVGQSNCKKKIKIFKNFKISKFLKNFRKFQNLKKKNSKL